MPKKEERSFSYQKRSKDALKERANMKGGNFDTYIKPKFKQWKPKEGKNIIRILPPTWDNARHYGLDIYINFNIGPDNQSYLSLSKHGKGEDPIAEARREALSEGDKDFAKKLSFNQRILYWIIDRADEDEGPLLWAAPFTFDKSLSNLCIDEDTKEVVFIDDPVKGRDVRFYKEGQGLKTTYDPSKMKVLKESTVHEDEGIENEWLDFIAANPLPEVLNFYDYDHIKAQFDGQIGKRDDDDEDEPKKPSRSRASRDEDEAEERPSTRSRRAKDPEVDESDDPPKRKRVRREADEEFDDEDSPPARRKPSRAADEDEDEEPAPRKPSRKTVEADDGEENEKPSRRPRSRVAEDEDEDPPSTRRGKESARSAPDDDEEGGGSLRERLARRRSRSSDDD